MLVAPAPAPIKVLSIPVVTFIPAEFPTAVFDVPVELWQHHGWQIAIWPES